MAGSHSLLVRHHVYNAAGFRTVQHMDVPNQIIEMEGLFTHDVLRALTLLHIDAHIRLYLWRLCSPRNLYNIGTLSSLT